MPRESSKDLPPHDSIKIYPEERIYGVKIMER